MKNKFKIRGFFILFFLIIIESSLNAQIQDIKKNSNENKSSSSNKSSSGSISSNDDNSETCGCLFSLFTDFIQLLFSRPDHSENQNNYSNNPNNMNIDSSVVENQNNIPPQNFNPDNSKINEPDNQVIEKEKVTAEFSLDINANFALGFETSKDKTYTYVDYLPGLRANLAWFLIDFRYNLLTETTNDFPDAFKTWDLMFLFNVRASDNTKIIFGTGLHREEYTSTNFNQHFLGFKFGLRNNRDYINIDGRLTIDYSANEYPFSEVGIHYNTRIINAKNLNGYISLGGLYQNYYNSTDIWAFRAGITLNWHN